MDKILNIQDFISERENERKCGMVGYFIVIFLVHQKKTLVSSFIRR